MKHDVVRTVKVLLWLLFSIALSYIMAPLALLEAPAMKMDPRLFIIVIVAVILVSALGWYFLMKKFEVKYVELMFALVLAAMLSRVIGLFFPEVGQINMAGFFYRLAIVVVLMFLFMRFLRMLQRSWKNVLRWYWLMNLLMSVVMVTAGLFIGLSIVPWVALLLLFLLSLYDVYAVYISKHMISFAKFFIKRRFLPGIAVPYRDKRRFAVLGGGDVLFMVMVSSSFYRVNPALMLLTAFGMFMSIVILFLLSKEKRFYPALPFILAGAVIPLGVLLWLS